MKIKVTSFAVNRRQAKKAARAASGRGFIAWPLDRQNFGLIQHRDGVVTVVRMRHKRAAYPHHWSQLDNGWLQ